MRKDFDPTLRSAQIVFKMIGVGPLRQITRPVESRWMFDYYERQLLRMLGGVKDQEKYKSFTESFAGDTQIASFSARYNQRVEIYTAEDSRVLVWNSVSNHGLLNTTGITFLKLVIKHQAIESVNLSLQKVPKNSFLNLTNPDYHEITKDNLNRWYFLEMLNRELADFDLV